MYTHQSTMCSTQTAPNNFLTSLFVFGGGNNITPWILSEFNFLHPFPIKWPRYFTSDSRNCNFCFGTLSPLFPRQFKSSVVVFLIVSSSICDIRKSSMYCKIRVLFFGSNSVSKVSSACPVELGDSVNPCDNLVHLSCCLLLVSGSSHSKANLSWLSSASGQDQNVSLRSITLNHWWSAGTFPNRVYGSGTVGYSCYRVFIDFSQILYQSVRAIRFFNWNCWSIMW